MEGQGARARTSPPRRLFFLSLSRARTHASLSVYFSSPTHLDQVQGQRVQGGRRVPFVVAEVHQEARGERSADAGGWLPFAGARTRLASERRG